MALSSLTTNNLAIGHSTNLIARDSNIIVIRGGHENSRPVYQQLLSAVQEFFPESGILDGDDTIPGVPHRQSSSQPFSQEPIPLHRIQTGISSIVGSGNGDRPGGFILVIDGDALTHVFEHDEHKALLLKLGTLCEGVICCRVSPCAVQLFWLD